MEISSSETNPLIALWASVAKGSENIEALPERLGDYHHDLLSFASSKPFERLVKRQLGSDDMSAAAGYTNIISWLTMAGGRNSMLFRPSLAATHKAFKFLLFMDIIKRRIMQGVHEALEPRFNTGALPEKGVLLAFTSRIEHAYMVSFDFGSGRPEIEIIDRIEQPRALFDLSHFPKLKSQRSKNAAKAVLSGGHKVILHCGVLTHVDRSVDRSVFGPTIDTLLLAEEVLAASDFAPERVLEIGCGNGHIVSAAAARMASVKLAVFIDVNPHATTCTLKNLKGNVSLHRPGVEGALSHCYGVTGPFSIEIPFGQTFDLVISNPPYIAMPPDFERGQIRAARVAVSGTELLEDIVRSARKLLSPTGRLLMMTSSTSADAINRGLPSGYVVEHAKIFQQLSVPFDVEDALDSPHWIAWLEAQSLVRRSKTGYSHDLIPVWIRRS